MAVEKSVLIRIGAQLGPGGKAAFRSVDKGIHDLGKSARQALNFGKWAALGIAGAAASIGYLVTTTANAGERIGQLSEITGFSPEFLSRLGAKARRAGTDIETVTSAVSKLQKDAAKHGDFRPIEELWTKAAKAIASTENPTRRAALAQAFFGKSGAQLIPMLLEWNKAGGEFVDIWTPEKIAKAKAYSDALDDLRDVAETFKNEFALGLMPVLTQGMKDIAEWSKSTDAKQFWADQAESVKTVAAAVKELVGYYMEAERFWKTELVRGPGMDPEGQTTRHEVEMGRGVTPEEIFAYRQKVRPGRAPLGGELARRGAGGPVLAPGDIPAPAVNVNLTLSGELDTADVRRKVDGWVWEIVNQHNAKARALEAAAP